MSQTLQNKLQKELDTTDNKENDYKSNELKGNLNKIQISYQPPDLDANDSYKYSLKHWWNTIEAHAEDSYSIRVDIYERALKWLPGSYKLWYTYLSECLEHLEGKSIISPKYDVIKQLFERALIFMNKMPRIWLMYCELLTKQNKITQTRQTFDRALTALPVTQHEKIWEVYSKWALSQVNLPQTAKTVLKRYLKLNPDFMETLVEYLIQIEDWDEAAIYITKILDDNGYVSPTGKTKYQFLMDLCKIISNHPESIKSIDCESIIRHGIKKYTDEVGNLFVSLAQYFIEQALFEKARDVFEEALDTILTARDFGIIFNAYVKFEEEMLNVVSEKDQDEVAKDDIVLQEIKKTLGIKEDMVEKEDEDMEIEYKIYRLEKLVERRPLLLNNVLLRQNPNNVNEWIKRVRFMGDEAGIVAKTFAEALTTIDPMRAEGKLYDLWIMWADFYRSHGDLKNANQIFNKATKINFRTLDELATIWSAWVEMLITEEQIEDAFTVIKQALFKRPAEQPTKKINSQQREQGESKAKWLADSIHLSTKLWALYVDMESIWGKFDTTKAAYQRMIDLKVITPQMLLNYIYYLQKNQFYEESFKAYEAGVYLFEGDWNILYDLWINYLKAFVERYESEKIERARDLFEKVIASAPQDKKLVFYLMYADLEEKYGLINHAMEVYDKMVDAVPYEKKEEALYLYIMKVSQYLGVTKTRAIFEKGIEGLRDKEMVKVGMKYAKLEKRLGEVDRARAIYSHISQFTDPQQDLWGLWKEWDTFELQHGNEDTYKEKMRVHRAVMAKFAIRPPSLQELEEAATKEDAKTA